MRYFFCGFPTLKLKMPLRNFFAGNLLTVFPHKNELNKYNKDAFVLAGCLDFKRWIAQDGCFGSLFGPEPGL